MQRGYAWPGTSFGWLTFEDHPAKIACTKEDAKGKEQAASIVHV